MSNAAVKRISAIVVSAMVAVLLGLLPASADKRVALVIGNAAYQSIGELKNPTNDAADIAAALKSLGFQLIGDRAHLDLDKASMDRAVRDFAEAIVGADVGLFFYSGHGLQVGGVNYLVPVDAKLTSAAGLDFELLRLDLVQRQMEREASTNVLFLDACRDDPKLTRNISRAMGTRSVDVRRGLAGAESGVGTLISFATQPGNVAYDGAGGRNSPFTTALLKHIEAREDLSGILISVRNDVRAATAGRQVPWENSALTGRFYFREPDTTTALPPARQAVVAAPPATIARLLQIELKRVGCNTGDTDGEWGPASRNAMVAFNRYAKTKFGIEVASVDALDAVRGMKSRVCPLECGTGLRAEGDKCVEIPKTAARPTEPPTRKNDAAPSGGSQRVACDRFGCRQVPPKCHVEKTFDTQFGPTERIICP